MLSKQIEEQKTDPRIRRTRQLLQQALMDLLKEKSFQTITVQDIAERATVNRVTFYDHFEGKYALLEYTTREMFKQRLYSELPEGCAYSPENLAQLILAVCEFVAEMKRSCPPPHTQFEPLMEKQIKAELAEFLQGWLTEISPVSSGNVQGVKTPELAATITSWAIYGAAVLWNQKKHPEPAWEYVQQVLPMVLGSIQDEVRVEARPSSSALSPFSTSR